MRGLALVAVIGVALANIGMNFFVRRAAVQSEGYARALGSGSFLVGLLVGSVSILTLLAVYRFQVNLSQGILLMGAVSIVGGSLLGVALLRNRLHPIEWALLVTIAVLFGLRWVLVLSRG